MEDYIFSIIIVNTGCSNNGLVKIPANIFDGFRTLFCDFYNRRISFF